MSSLFNKRLEDITLTSILDLIKNQSYENKFIDFKKTFPSLEVNDSKNGFLKDITAFANTEGGDIIYGVSEINGIASESVGIDNHTIDESKLSLESIIRDNVEPNMIKYDFKIIPCSENKSIIILRVFKSLNKPHYITLRLKDRERFFLRTSSGNAPMSYAEIRNSFLQSDENMIRIKEKRKIRIYDILNNETDLILEGKSFMTLHICPLNTNIINSKYLDLDIIKTSSGPFISHDLTNIDINSERYSLNGFIRYGGSNYDNRAKRYALFFRNCDIEYLTSNVFYKEKYLGGIFYENEVLNISRKSIKYYKNLNIQPPLVFQLSFIKIKGFMLDVNLDYLKMKESHPADREIILIPEILIEDYNINLESAFKTLFDMVWNIFGYPGCINYDEEGNRRNGY